MGEAIGAKTIDLEWVQVHPTGLVKPDDPDAKVKFLAAEALRGVGGFVLDAGGKRFANELGRRDYVTGEMWKNKPPFRLCLNKAASDEISWHCKPWANQSPTSNRCPRETTTGNERTEDRLASVGRQRGESAHLRSCMKSRLAPWRRLDFLAQQYSNIIK